MNMESRIEPSAPGVLISRDAIIRIGMEAIERVKIEARRSPRKRARINAHKSLEDSVHEMLIALDRETYLRPHRHVGKSESFHVIEGIADVVIFDPAGGIVDAIRMGPPGGDRCFFYRQSESCFHTLVIHSPIFVIHETTNGPFAPDRTVFAPWAPEEDAPEADAYVRDLRARLASFLSAR
jgi:cupin fold WbuC family metalloprotein